MRSFSNRLLIAALFVPLRQSTGILPRWEVCLDTLIRNLQWIDENPCRNLIKLKESPKGRRIVTPEEEKEMWRECNSKKTIWDNLRERNPNFDLLSEETLQIACFGVAYTLQSLHEH